MYSAIRIILATIVYLGIVLIINRLKLAKKPRKALSAILLIVILTAVALIPFENLFMTFPSLEAAYKYTHPGKTNIVLIVEGDECDLVYDRKSDGYELDFIPKTPEGWKVGAGIDSKTVVYKHQGETCIRVERYKRTDDFFISIAAPLNESLDISDSKNSEFTLLQSEKDEFTLREYIAHISGFDENYKLFINGEAVELNQY